MNREFFDCCTNNNLVFAKQIWSENNNSIDLEFKYIANTALTLSAYKGYTDVVKWLIELGARLNATTDSGQTALIRAAFRGHEDIVKALIEAGADIDIKDKAGKTALDYVNRREYPLVASCLEAKAKSNKRKKDIAETSVEEYFKKISMFCAFLEDDYGESCFSPPATDIEIANWESENGISIPDSYKEWLRFTNGCEIAAASANFYGLEGIIACGQCLPDDLVLIGDVVGDGEHICFSKTSGKFVWEDHGKLDKHDSFKNILAYVVRTLERRDFEPEDLEEFKKTWNFENFFTKSELSELIEKIREITKADEFGMEFFPAATDNEIQQFEKENDVALPHLFKEWLKFTDGCCLFDTTIQLYGIAHKPFIETNPKGITGDYICIGAFNFGDYICVSNNSQTITQYGETLTEYASFKEFLESAINISMEILK